MIFSCDIRSNSDGRVRRYKHGSVAIRKARQAKRDFGYGSEGQVVELLGSGRRLARRVQHLPVANRMHGFDSRQEDASRYRQLKSYERNCERVFTATT